MVCTNTVNDDPAQWSIVDSTGGEIAETNSVNIADARLIASAPDLLAALCPLLGIAEADCMDDKSNVWRSAMITARAAIARATGDQS
jgi:hypothetical protein